MGLEEVERDDIILVCGGIDVQKATTKPVLNWLRREARRGVTIGGLCTGSYALAKAGLLDGKKATIHWENQDGFLEEFEEVKLTKSVFVMDGNRWSTAGGTSSLDLILKVVAADHGDDVANTVADQLIYSTIRTDQDTQRLSIPTRIGVRHPKLSQVIQMMEGNIEDPMSPADLAEEVGMSTRQLERLFRRYLNRTPKRYYMELRLQKARNLLMQTDMSVINVALACGFASPVAFLEMLPQPLQHHALPRTRHPRRAGPVAVAAVDLNRRGRWLATRRALFQGLSVWLTRSRSGRGLGARRPRGFVRDLRLRWAAKRRVWTMTCAASPAAVRPTIRTASPSGRCRCLTGRRQHRGDRT